jgi:hypothetical protein
MSERLDDTAACDAQQLGRLDQEPIDAHAGVHAGARTNPAQVAIVARRRGKARRRKRPEQGTEEKKPRAPP